MDRIPRTPTSTCLIEGCHKPVKARGWCGAHYKAWGTHGDPLVNKARRAVVVPCSVAGCGKIAQTRGLCDAHYRALRRHGDPTIRKNNSVLKPCSADGCQKLTTRTYCNAHEVRFRRYGDANYRPPRVSDSFCTVEGCGRRADTAGLCRSHYARSRRQGGTEGPALPVMLTVSQMNFIRESRGTIDAIALAKRIGTSLTTIIAVQAGRNWGVIRSAAVGEDVGK